MNAAHEVRCQLWEVKIPRNDFRRVFFCDNVSARRVSAVPSLDKLLRTYCLHLLSPKLCHLVGSVVAAGSQRNIKKKIASRVVLNIFYINNR